jgi:hypothetical protein
MPAKAPASKNRSHYRLLTIVNLPATNTKPAKYRIVDNETKESVVRSFKHDHPSNYAFDQAETFLREKGFNIVGYTSLNYKYDSFLSDSFDASL